MKKGMSIRLSEELVEKIKKIATEENRSFNYIVTKLIERGLQNL